ncbi:MAG TPA: hypothetical protein VGF67_02530 [Ktedonobacteraceae bacterium]
MIKRVRTLGGADLAHRLISGWWQEPEIAWEGLRQLLGRREVQITSSGLSQRLTPEAAECVRRLREDVAARCLRAEESAPTELLHRFRAVILEERSVVGLPAELASIWKGCGGHPGASTGGVKLFVRWDGRGGQWDGPRLTDARQNDRHRPFEASDVPAGSRYSADLGFVGLPRLQDRTHRQGRVKGSVISRMWCRTNRSLRNGHQWERRGI